MNIIVASKAGACYGVNRALDLALNCDHAPQPVHTLGPLIHNPLVVADLEARGVGEASTLEEAAEGTIVIRSHGTAPQVIQRASKLGFHVIDATCPFVSKVQQNARQLGEEGYSVVIVGEAGHAEVEGIRAWGGDAVFAVVEEPEELPEELPAKVGVVVQTTQSEPRYNRVLAALEERCEEIRAYKTICNATQQRQEAAAELAGKSQVMVVIGGRNSGNTKRLAEICQEFCTTYHVESAVELDPAWFAGVECVGITAGASTPHSHINEVVTALEAMA